ncbi:hypothetical protein EDD11_001604 [Mortierella claussenii]|nr:hypothetical protein EDD11_001604 [Mortierella claussenii]
MAFVISESFSALKRDYTTSGGSSNNNKDGGVLEPSLFRRGTSSSIQQQRHNSQLLQLGQVSTKALAFKSCATGGSPPPPLMGSAIVLANNSALHCFGGRLENRDLTNCHYVLDVETGLWETIQAASIPNTSERRQGGGATDNAAEVGAASVDTETYLSLSLTTDPVDTNSGSISDGSIMLPRPRYFHTLNAFGTSLILFGGMGKVPDSEEGDGAEQESNTSSSGDSQGRLAALDDLWVFDIITQRWQQKHIPVTAYSPKARWAHMATILDHFLVVIGGTDTEKAYVEDACVLDLHSWRWVASINAIGQCGSYRTVVATGPSKQSSTVMEPTAPSFPSADACSPQTSAYLARPLTDSGPVDAMASISMVLSGRISAPSSITSSSKGDDANDTVWESQSCSNKLKSSERLMSGDLTPAFKTGKDVPSIYLYSNYNFQNLQRDFKVITPHYTHPPVVGSDAQSNVATTAPPPSFSIVERSQALNMMGTELPPGLRFPQGHVYQNQLIVTGTLIVPGKAPTLAIYAFNLSLYKWDCLVTDNILETGSWNRTLLHPATGTLLIFGNHGTDAETDYANRIQHHDHLMLLNLQAYGLYDRPIPSLPQAAQELGRDLLMNPSLSDMHIASVSGTLFRASSAILSARWPEFATLLLSPPYVTPLILVLPVPDEIVPLFLQYFYTGALPTNITAGVADYLLILARRYELNGLYALIMDILHQTVRLHPIRVYSSALMAGELGLQARAIGMAMHTLPSSKNRPTSISITLAPGALPYLPGATEGKELPPLPSPASTTGSGRTSIGFSRGTYSGRIPEPPAPSSLAASNSTPSVSTHRRTPSRQSQESLSTDGGFVQDGLLQQYQGVQRRSPTSIQEGGEAERQLQSRTFFLSSPAPRRQRSMRSPPLKSSPGLGAGVHDGQGGNYMSPLNTAGLTQGSGDLYHAAYPSPSSPSFQHLQSFSSQQIGFGYEDYPSLDERTLQAKRRLDMQMQRDVETLQQQQNQQQSQRHHQQHQEYLMQQQLLLEQQHMRDQELMLLEQHRLQHQRYLQRQQKLKAQQLLAETPSPAAVLNALDYHFGGNGGGSGSGGSRQAPAPFKIRAPQDEDSMKMMGESSSGKNEKDKKKDKKLLSKMKPPKPTLSGADLMKSAGF